MAISDEITRLTNAKAAIKTAIEGKGVTVPSSTLLDGYAALITSIPSGGSTNEISFPAWVKDGDTHLWIDIRDSYQLDQQIRIRMIGTIDWGDGSTAQSVSVTTYTTFTHTYSALGKYRIDLHPTSGTFYLGGASSSYSVMGTLSGRGHIVSSLYQAEIGTSRITILSTHSFYYCRGLIRAYVPSTIVDPKSSYVFGYCYSLKEVEFQDSSTITQTSGSGSMFAYCYSLQDVDGYAPPHTTILSAIYRSCAALAEITIPMSVTTIQSNAVNGCTSLKVIHCLPTTPPTIADANAFAPPAACVIKVPKGSLSSYQAGTTWSDYASQMEEASLITLTLTSVSSSNKALMVDLNESYTTTLVPDTGKTIGTVTVKMGGTDITSTAYSAGVVTIASVTGNIEITASAS